MDDCLINSINAIVKPNDELWCLGDFAWKASRYGHYRQRLRVRTLHAIYGNHDVKSLRKHVSSAQDMVCRKFDGTKIHMTHYPLASWSSREYGSIHLYGHCHGSMEVILNSTFPGRRAMDVGVDNIFNLTGEWRPISLTEVFHRLKDQDVHIRDS
jgi:calcineurin-like phosphoesterase family protein